VTNQPLERRRRRSIDGPCRDHERCQLLEERAVPDRDVSSVLDVLTTVEQRFEAGMSPRRAAR
jgi:hypothetical protein